MFAFLRLFQALQAPRDQKVGLVCLLAGCHKTLLNQAVSVLSVLIVGYFLSDFFLFFTPFIFIMFAYFVPYLLVVLVWLSMSVQVTDQKDSSPKCLMLMWTLLTQ